MVLVFWGVCQTRAGNGVAAAVRKEPEPQASQRGRVSSKEETKDAVKGSGSSGGGSGASVFSTEESLRKMKISKGQEGAQSKKAGIELKGDDGKENKLHEAKEGGVLSSNKQSSGVKEKGKEWTKKDKVINAGIKTFMTVPYFRFLD